MGYGVMGMSKQGICSLHFQEAGLSRKGTRGEGGCVGAGGLSILIYLGDHPGDMGVSSGRFCLGWREGAPSREMGHRKSRDFP